MLHYTKKNEMWQPRYVHPSSKKCLGILRCAPPFLAKIGSSHVFDRRLEEKRVHESKWLFFQYSTLHYITIPYITVGTLQYSTID